MASTIRHILPLLLWLTCICSFAQDSVSVTTSPSEETEADSITVSILTCTPGTELYAQFGHTALRVQNNVQQLDIVFNYGCFDYRVENFMLKFILGQTDYRLEAEHFPSFMYRYEHAGIGVTEQRLNLTQPEAQRLFSLLLENISPENQEYRYQWLGNNCTNKVQFLMEKLIAEENGKVLYANYDGEECTKTVRDLLHEKLEKTPWTCFGIDMLLGQQIDENLSSSTSPIAQLSVNMFLPSVFMAVTDKAVIERTDGTKQPYVSQQQELIPAVQTEEAPLFFSPILVFSLLLCAAIAISVLDFKHQQVSLWLDITLSAVQGLAGLLIAFLFFFSEHPGVDSNWLVIIFNPIPLFYAGWLVICHRRQMWNRLALANVIVLALFLLIMLLPWCPQVFNPAMYLVVLTLLVRAIIYYIIVRLNTKAVSHSPKHINR